MEGKREIGQLMREAIQRGRAAERAKGLAALTLVVKKNPDNLVAFLWLAPCVARPEVKAPRIPPSRSTDRAR